MNLHLFLNMIANMNIKNYLDIIVVALVFYNVFIFIKKTRAEQLFKGLLVILLVMKCSEIFGLSSLHWILKNTLTVGLIAVIVLFQPELRKALEQIGRKNFISNFSSKNNDKLINIIDEIISAVTKLSETKTGALIVMEQTTGLNEYVSTGTYIDSKISSSLIENIFTKNTALHDGAVIVRDDRIVSAACVLPLSDISLAQHYGTRHRAALGISEISDCIAIIVSEETGLISLAIGGRIHSPYEPAKFKTKLIKILNHGYEDETIRKKVKNWLLEKKK